MRPILINTRFTGRTVTGTERYAGNLFNLLAEKLTPISPPRNVQGLPGHLWEQFLLPWRLPTEALLWSPANTGPVLVANHVLTLHDIGPLEHPDWYRPSFAFWYRVLTPIIVKRATRILTVSEFSKSRIVSRLKADPAKITVTHQGVDKGIFFPRNKRDTNEVRKKYALPDQYALFVGPANPRKNFQTAQAALEIMERPLQMVTVGSVGSQFSTTGQNKGLNLGRVPDRDLAAIYTAAAVYINPSHYEGGALTILEAMACGCPVIASNRGAFPEYAGKAALLVDPRQPAQLAAALHLLLDDSTGRDALVKMGRRQARKFSWENCAVETWDVLRSLV